MAEPNQVDDETANQISKILDNNHIVTVADDQSSEKSLEVLESENIQEKNYSHNILKLNKKSSTENQGLPFRNNSMPRKHSMESFSCEDEILKKLEAVKKLAQNEAEINAAIRSLKTNLILCLILILIFALLPALNQTFSTFLVSLMKGFVPILTTISNFGKIKSLVWCY